MATTGLRYDWLLRRGGVAIHGFHAVMMLWIAAGKLYSLIEKIISFFTEDFYLLPSFPVKLRVFVYLVFSWFLRLTDFVLCRVFTPILGG